MRHEPGVTRKKKKMKKQCMYTSESTSRHAIVYGRWFAGVSTRELEPVIGVAFLPGVGLGVCLWFLANLVKYLWRVG